jgi:hypothetical protein
METEQENRPVFMTGARAPLTPDMRLPGARSAEPCARDPPTLCRGGYQRFQQGLRRACHGNPPGEDLPTCKAANGERRCVNIASPERRT